MRKYTGLNIQKELEERSEKDHVFGGLSSPCIALIPTSVRKFYLPDGELQNIGEEKSDCATRAPINILESKLNWLLEQNLLLDKEWYFKNGYIVEGKFSISDAFIAIKSGTTESGNSLKAPLRAIENNGLIPKTLLPQALTFKEHHNPNRITKKMESLGLEFRERLPIKYDKVYRQDFPNLIKKDLIDSAGFAWPEPENGEYGYVNYAPNHAFAVLEPQYEIFDNYEENKGDFIKKLKPEYNFFEYGYRVYIKGQYKPKKCFWIKRILNLCPQVQD